MLCFHSLTIEVVVGIDAVAFGISCFEFAVLPFAAFAGGLRRVVGFRKIGKIEFHPGAVDHS
jgi:hypothetical protein